MISDYFQNRTMQDPAVPMIQLPMKFKSRRTNTATVPKTTPEAYYVDIFDVEGAGCIRHIWFLFAKGRRIEITVDGAEKPQVDMPLKSFFGIMHDWTPYFIDNAAFTVLPNYETPQMPGNPGYNLWLPIPFSQSCRIRLYVDQPPDGRVNGLHGSVCTMVDWHQYEDDSSLTPFRFHAEHHLYKPAPARNSTYQIADVDGTGFMAGVVLGSRQRNYTDMIYHTGGMSILIDGENQPNVIRGTNMEDDFGFSWGFHVKNGRWIGSPYHKWGGHLDQDGVIYRFFGPDPIAFDSSISFSCGSRDDEIETVAYYYKVPDTESSPVVTPTQWLISGFYENGDDWDNFNTAEEIESIPLDQWTAHFSDDTYFIRKVSANRGWIDFRFSGIDPQLHAGHFAGRSMYASAILDSDVDKDMTLRLSFDDWFKVWVNGQLVGTWQNDSNFETIRIPVQLKKGRNEFLLKSNNIGHEWNSWVANFVLE